MKFIRQTCIIALALSTAWIPASLAAQGTAEPNQLHQYHHYQLINLATLRRSGRHHGLGLQSTSVSPQLDSSEPESTPCFNGGNPGICLTLTALSPGTVSLGGTATSTVTLAASGGFNGEVGLSCSVQPSPALAPTCLINGLNDGKALPDGSPISLTVSTTGPTAAVMPFKAGSGFLALWLPLIGLVGTGVGLGSRQKKKGRIPPVALACMLFAGLAFLVSCSGSSMSNSGGTHGTPAGLYTITVLGVPNGAPQVSVTTPLTVQ